MTFRSNHHYTMWLPRAPKESAFLLDENETSNPFTKTYSTGMKNKLRAVENNSQSPATSLFR
jgi:hypothetical protein